MASVLRTPQFVNHECITAQSPLLQLTSGFSRVELSTCCSRPHWKRLNTTLSTGHTRQPEKISFTYWIEPRIKSPRSFLPDVSPLSPQATSPPRDFVAVHLTSSDPVSLSALQQMFQIKCRKPRTWSVSKLLLLSNLKLLITAESEGNGVLTWNPNAFVHAPLTRINACHECKYTHKHTHTHKLHIISFFRLYLFVSGNK